MTGPWATAYVGLGGNLGEVHATLEAALARLAALPDTRLLARSRFYRTPAWGLTEQPDFINAVAALETRLPPLRLLESLLEIERLAGRVRDPGQRWGPRSLDLDLLLHGQASEQAPGLQLPHPRLHERAFVLVPLAEIAPDLVVPGRGRVRDLLAAVDATGVGALP